MTCLKIFYLITLYTLDTVVSEREDIHHMMYESFSASASCFRIFNGTHQFGCSTAEAGSTGVVHLVNTESDVQWLLQEAQAAPYMVLIPIILFKEELMTRLVDSGKVSGVLVAADDTQLVPDEMSPEVKCPNRYSSLADSCDEAAPWNPLGQGFLRRNWPVALFLSTDPAEYKSIKDCFSKFNLPLEGQQDRSLCALMMKGRMFGAVDTPTCLRRSRQTFNSFSVVTFCDPMGDVNLVSQLFPRTPYQSANGSIVLVSARMDAAGLFDQVSPGAMSTVTGLVTLLTTAHLLSRLLPQHKDSYTKNVVLALMNGEAQDYIGSSRVVYDMQQGKFLSEKLPLTLEQLDQVIDLSQLDGSRTLHCHCFQSHVAMNTIDLLTKTGKQFGVSVEGSCSSGRLPPSSLHTFLKANISLPGVILTNHGARYVNKFYHSIQDDPDYLKYKYSNGSQLAESSLQSSLASVAQSLTLTLAQLVDPSITWPANITTAYTSALVDELLNCYLMSRNCAMFNKVVGPLPGEGPLPLYVGVSRVTNTISRLTFSTLAHLTGTPTNRTEDKCRTNLLMMNYNYVWVGPSDSGVCMRTGVVTHTAVSPAFEIEDYNWTSGQYSTLTESVWTELGLRMYVKPAFRQELNTFMSGLVVLVLSFALVFWIHRNSDHLFSPPGRHGVEECPRC